MEPKQESLLLRLASWVWPRPKPIDNGSQPKHYNPSQMPLTEFVMWIIDVCATALSPYVPGDQRLHFLMCMNTIRKVACINKTYKMLAQGTDIIWLQILARFVHHSPMQIVGLSEKNERYRRKEIIYCMHLLALNTDQKPYAKCVWLSNVRNMFRAYRPTIEGPAAHASLAALGMRMNQNNRNILVQTDDDDDGYDGYEVADVLENMPRRRLWEDCFMVVEDFGYGLVQFSLRTSIVLWDDVLLLSWVLRRGSSQRSYTVWNGAAQPAAGDSHLLFFNGSSTERCVDIIAEQGDALGLEIHGLPFSPVQCSFRVATSVGVATSDESGNLVYSSMTQELIASDLQKINDWILAIKTANGAAAKEAAANGAAAKEAAAKGSAANGAARA
jgi:hypothetical protein